MHFRVLPAAFRRAKSRIAGPIALALGALLLGPAGAVMGKGDAPAVWVPASPGVVEAGKPVVLVPFTQSLTLAAPSLGVQPWVPDYLSAPVSRGTGVPAPGAAATAPTEGAAADPAAVPLSQVLRATHWRRDTARRLRTQPAFKPRF